jgi:hypothetical protein
MFSVVRQLRFDPKKVIETFIVIALLFTNNYGHAQASTSGLIKFSDGTERRFSAVRYVHTGDEAFKNGFPAFYQNAFRTIPFEKLVTVIISAGVIESGRRVVNANLRITTVTNVVFDTKMNLQQITVSVLDDLTGQYTDISYPFCDQNKILIEEIVFH